MKQMLVFTNAYGDGVSKPDVKYESIHEYLLHGWRVASITGTGIASASTALNRGSFCFLLEQYMP